MLTLYTYFLPLLCFDPSLGNFPHTSSEFANLLLFPVILPLFAPSCNNIPAACSHTHQIKLYPGRDFTAFLTQTLTVRTVPAPVGRRLQTFCCSELASNGSDAMLKSSTLDALVHVILHLVNFFMPSSLQLETMMFKWRRKPVIGAKEAARFSCKTMQTVTRYKPTPA